MFPTPASILKSRVAYVRMAMQLCRNKSVKNKGGYQTVKLGGMKLLHIPAMEEVRDATFPSHGERAIDLSVLWREPKETGEDGIHSEETVPKSATLRVSISSI